MKFQPFFKQKNKWCFFYIQQTSVHYNFCHHKKIIHIHENLSILGFLKENQVKYYLRHSFMQKMKFLWPKMNEWETFRKKIKICFAQISSTGKTHLFKNGQTKPIGLDSFLIHKNSCPWGSINFVVPFAIVMGCHWF